MASKLTDTAVKGLAVPTKGNKIHYDSEVKGFGCRVTASGARAFVLNYRTRKGRERRITIGSFPDWKVNTARQEASDLKRKIDCGEDPLASVDADRAAKSMADLCARYAEEYLPAMAMAVAGSIEGRAKLRPSTQREYDQLIRNNILPAMKHLSVADVTFSDCDGLHRKMTRRGTPYAANRTLATLSKMLNCAIKWGWRSDNPARGIERNQEEKRHRYLSMAELAELTKALDDHRDQQAANIIRMLLLTGSRRGEVMAARWEQFDLTNGVWTKPGSTTKQKTLHRVPLSAPARQLLARIRADAKPGSDYVFPGRSNGHRIEIKGAWRDLCRASGIVIQKTAVDAKGKEKVVIEPSARIHDLRHTYASVLASAGLSLPIIGALLGHTQPSTTARYAHLMDDPLRAATERAGALVMRTEESAEIVPLKGTA